jgi:hypothetical protein
VPQSELRLSYQAPLFLHAAATIPQFAFIWREGRTVNWVGRTSFVWPRLWLSAPATSYLKAAWIRPSFVDPSHVMIANAGVGWRSVSIA